MASGKLAAPDAVVPILGALTTNAISRAVLAMSSGGVRFAIPLMGGLLAQIASAWGVALIA